MVYKYLFYQKNISNCIEKIVYVQCLLVKPDADGPIRARSERRALSSCKAFRVLVSNGLFPVLTRSFFTLAFIVLAFFFAALYLVCNCSIDRFSTFEFKIVKNVCKMQKQLTLTKQIFPYINSLSTTIIIESIFDLGPCFHFCQFIRLTITIFVDDVMEPVTSG